MVLAAIGRGAAGAAGAPARGAARRRRAASSVTSPMQEWKHNVGDDYFLANYQQLTAYWRKLEKESNRLKLFDIGKTSEGRPMLMAVITSPANHQKLARYKEISAGWPTPRG